MISIVCSSQVEQARVSSGVGGRLLTRPASTRVGRQRTTLVMYTCLRVMPFFAQALNPAMPRRVPQTACPSRPHSVPAPRQSASGALPDCRRRKPHWRGFWRDRRPRRWKPAPRYAPVGQFCFPQVPHSQQELLQKIVLALPLTWYRAFIVCQRLEIFG